MAYQLGLRRKYLMRTGYLLSSQDSIVSHCLKFVPGRMLLRLARLTIFMLLFTSVGKRLVPTRRTCLKQSGEKVAALRNLLDHFKSF